jgi:glycosyltransferase involved in cell wall biosynthesis
MSPRVSVVVRSYNRLPACCELIEALLGQDHPSFEVVVVEQSTDKPDEAVARLAALEQDPRLTVLRVPPQGGPRARNLGVQHTRGEVVVVIDDDDLPRGKDFLSKIELPFLEDPKCVGASCRHFWKEDDDIGPVYRFYAWRRCMRFSPLTRVAYTYPRYDKPVRPVDWVHGTGGAYRRSVFERFGGWDEDTPIEDEASLAIRMKRGLEPDEYICFDPRAKLQRRMGLAGGLAKRWMTPGKFYSRFMTFVHHVLGRYYPWRVRLLYPIYVWAGYRWTVAWLWDDSIAHDTFLKRLGGTIALTASLPWHAVKMLREPLGHLPGSGESLRERLTPRDAAVVADPPRAAAASPATDGPR